MCIWHKCKGAVTKDDVKDVAFLRSGYNRFCEYGKGSIHDWRKAANGVIMLQIRSGNVAAIQTNVPMPYFESCQLL